MGWKSTIDLDRKEAIKLVIDELLKVSSMSNSELEDFLELLGFGEDSSKPYIGHNFRIND